DADWIEPDLAAQLIAPHRNLDDLDQRARYPPPRKHHARKECPGSLDKRASSRHPPLLLQRFRCRGRDIPQNEVVMRFGDTWMAGVVDDVDVIHLFGLPGLQAGERLLSIHVLEGDHVDR